MTSYILRRLLLMIPTIFGIMVINFGIVQFAPGGPVERVLAQIQGIDVGATARISGGGGEVGGPSGSNFDLSKSGGAGGPAGQYRGAQGLDPEFVADIERQFGFDKPAHERFFQMIGNYLRFDFGESYFRDVSVLDLILETMHMSISLGLWTPLLTYIISIPLGIAMANRDGHPFVVGTSRLIFFRT